MTALRRLRQLCVYSVVLGALGSGLAITPGALGGSPAVDSAAAAPQAVPYFTEPSISPDRSEIAFVSGGDIWTVPMGGGEARLLVSHPATESRPLYSPDGRKLAFTSTRTGNGDIYLLTLDTGELKRLTFDDGFEQLDAWSRDGRWIYYSSTSQDIAGMNDIFRVSVDGGTPMQVSADRYANEYFSAPSPDGQAMAFTARGVVSSQWWRKGHSHLDESEIWLWREGAPPTYTPVTAGGAKDVWPMWSADGRALFFVSDRSGAQNIWTRTIYPARTDQPEPPAQRNAPRREAPSKGGRTNRSASETQRRDLAEEQTAAATPHEPATQGVSANAAVEPSIHPDSPRQVTQFRDGRVLWPNISYDGRTIVFERNFAIWKLDTESGTATQIPISRRGAPVGPAVDHLTLTNQFQELQLSPDGKKVAFVVHGQVFAASAKDGGDAVRVTATAARESQVAWSPDSRRLAYVSDRDGAEHIYLFDFTTGLETRLTNDAGADDTPVFSRDGKLIAFQRGGRELRVIDLEAKQDRLVTTAALERPPVSATRPFAWSPDSKWIAYVPVENKLFKNVWVARLPEGRESPKTGGARPESGPGSGNPISFLANTNSDTVSWSPDGTFILFDTGQRTEPSQLARIDLIPRVPRFREDQFRDLFREETPRSVAPSQRLETRPNPASDPSAAGSPGAGEEQKKAAAHPVEINFDSIRRRLSLVPAGVDVDSQMISPDGKSLLMVANAAGQQNLYIYSLDELSREPAVARQVTSTPGGKSYAQFSPDGKEIYYLEQGRINIAPIETRQPRPLTVTAEMDVDFAREKLEVFHQAWTYLRDNFFDPGFNGVDWQAVRADYEPRIAGARTPDEMRRLLTLMVGELNASHLGVGAPFGSVQQSTGRLGLRFDRHTYESGGRLRVTEVIPLGPAALSGDIRVGDYLLAVGGVQIAAHTNLDEVLNFKIGRRVVLTLSASAQDSNKREVAVRPANAGTEKGLLYRKWVEEKRQYVAHISGGRLGYVHMFDMSSQSLAQLYVDLDTENFGRDGVVIDIRNNNGGFVNAYALDVMARRGYMTMAPRGFAAAPARTVLGQRALALPTILVTNQHSLSDAEDFTEGYRALKLGKVVGEPTAGWIIYTWNVLLIDGSSLRLPRMRISASDGSPMEMRPRPVDVSVVRPIGESYSDRDSQLDAAVRELMKQFN